MRSLVRCDRTHPLRYHNIPMKKSFLSSLLTLPVSKCYCNLHELRNLCLNYEIQVPRQRKFNLKQAGRQAQLINELACHPRSLQMSWTLLDALTANLKLRFNFSNTLSHYWQSSKINFPVTLSQVVFEGFFAPKQSQSHRSNLMIVEFLSHFKSAINSPCITGGVQ